MKGKISLTSIFYTQYTCDDDDDDDDMNGILRMKKEIIEEGLLLW